MDESTSHQPEPLFLDGPGAMARLGDLTGDVITQLRGHHRLDRPWSGADTASLTAEIDALDPLPDHGVPIDAVLDEVGRVILANGIAVNHPWTAAHLHCPTLLTAAATEVAIGATNQSMDSFDQAPAATLVEDLLVRRLGELIGLPGTRSGVMTAGGTASNLLGLTLAREHAARHEGVDVASLGIGDRDVAAIVGRWRIVTSAAAHFSVVRAAMLLGLGRRSVIPVPVGNDGRMDVAALDRALDDCGRRGDHVIAVVGTAGTTDHGAIDPLDALAARAQHLDAWLHVDAAVGAALATSDTHRGRLVGIGDADSVTVDLHKLWWQPLGASTLLVARRDDFGLVRDHSDYLDRDEDVDAGVLNLVGRSLDTSRRFDALKVLVSLRSTGRKRFAALVDRVLANTVELARHVEGRDDLELVAPPNTVTVLFRWRGGSDGRAHDVADAVNTAVQRQLFESGRAVIGRTRVDGRVTLKITLMNPTVPVGDLTALVDEVAATAALVAARHAADAASEPGDEEDP